MEQDKRPYAYAGLIFKYLSGTLTPAEQQQLDEWLAADERNRALLASFSDPSVLKEDLEVFAAADADRGWEAVMEKAGYRVQPPARRLRVWPWAAAAAVLLGVGLMWKWPPGQQARQAPPAATAAAMPHDAPPGGNKAVLQLAGGQVVTLDNAAGDTIREADGTRISRRQGQLAYNRRQGAAAELQYNVLRTPRGGQYSLVLADGTAVWLNASSSLRFPTQFSGNERVVELSGEGYFEVAKNSKPFRVKVNGMEVAVLGTHFNIMGYKGITSTTLAEGAVKILLPGNRAWQLKPGQQAVVHENREINIARADIEKALAWKNGLFYFRNDRMSDVMEQLARWYDVEIQVKGRWPEKGISGNIRRQARLSQALEMLSYLSGAAFTIEGRIVTVGF